MPTSRRRARAVGSRLFGVYALASLVPVLVLGLVLVDTERAAGVERGLAQGRAQADVIEQMAVSPALDSASLDRGIAAQHVQRLRTATDLAIFSGSISRLRLRTFSGRVVFSDDGMMTSALPPSAQAFRAAAAGHADVAVVDDREISAGPTIRVLKPVVPNASGQAVGVLELYLPYAPIAAGVAAQLHTTYLQLGLGLTALYLVLGGVCWSTTRRLRQHAADREHQATHDSLTGLPNREHFRARAEEAVRAAGPHEPGALVLVDLDRFKQVNDTLGHHAGDELLQIVASRLAGSLRTDDVVARLGGDEFGLVLPRAGSPRQLVDLLTRVRDRLVADIELDGVTLNVEASFGVVLYPEHGEDVEHLLRAADVAMYRGKRSTNGIVMFDAEARREALDADGLALQSELRRALDRGELVLHYQPKLDLASGRVKAVEALLRWQHPERGLLGPHLFLPAAEQSGLIERLTAWVIEQALTDRAAWTAQGRRWAVAVNVSARNLESPALVGHVARLLRTTGTPPEQLYLEVTETAIAGDPVVAVATVQALAGTGVQISLDDFGVGYTSLSQLRSLPIAELKIDRAFVTDLPAPDSDRAIVAAVVQLAHGLGCTVTAEGVETAEAAAWLRAAGCDSAQGYHFARPAPWTELHDVDDAPPAPAALPALPTQATQATRSARSPQTVPTEELAAP